MASSSSLSARLLLVILIGILMVLRSTLGCGRGAIRFKDNGYKQIVVAVGDDVPDNPLLLQRIQEVFRAMSVYLYRATRLRGYLQEVKILLPTHWKLRPEYEVPGLEQYDSSDFTIDYPTGGSTTFRVPGVFAIKATGCGDPGHFVHVDPDLILNYQDEKNSPYGPIEKVLVHEWAHLRYGVFDEYPRSDDPHFYSGEEGQVEATRCTKAIQGWMYDAMTGRKCLRDDTNPSLPDKNCRFRDMTGKGKQSYASIMYRPHLEYTHDFCDNDPTQPKQLHNPDAPNVQNRMCNGRSVWEVLLSHKDFANAANPPKIIQQPFPTFTVYRQWRKRYVLVLDISRSMSFVSHHMPNLKRGCSNFIQNLVRVGEKVGIVTFSREAHVNAELTEVTDDNVRTSLINKLPTSVLTATSIGAGIREAIKVLERNGGNGDGTAKGGHIVLVTDGDENQTPTILDVQAEVYQSEASIHSIAFTNKADSRTDKLARDTGGLSFLYSDAGNSNALHEAFIAIAETNQVLKYRKLPLSSVSKECGPANVDRAPCLKGEVPIDESLGFNTEFMFDSTSQQDVYPEVTSPSGKKYTMMSPEAIKVPMQSMYFFKFSGQSETGLWKYDVKIPDGSKIKVTATVISQVSPNAKKEPVFAQAFWGYKKLKMNTTSGVVPAQKIYVSVSQGYRAVLFADVVAVVERPDKSVVNIKARDDGLDPDVNANDGIYTCYFKGFNQNQRYSVKVLVNSNRATIVSSVRVVGTRAPAKREDILNAPDTYQKISHLQRTAVGGSFQLSDFIPPAGKVYLPGQVTDLRVGGVNIAGSLVNLTWTAPGAELDDGTVSRYEIRYATTFKALRENFASQKLVTPQMVTSGFLTHPRSPRNRESVVIKMPKSGNITYVFRLVSWDESGRRVSSHPSNLVSAGMVPFTPKMPNDGSPVPVTNTVGIILGSVMGILLLIVLVIAIALVVRHVQVHRTSPSRPSTPLVANETGSGIKPGNTWADAWGNSHNKVGANVAVGISIPAKGGVNSANMTNVA